MNIYINTTRAVRRGDPIGVTITLPPTSPPNSRRKALTAAVITVAIGLTYWGLVLTAVPVEALPK